MADKDLIKKMLHNLINDKQGDAELDLHNYLVQKMRETSGLGQPASEAPAEIVAGGEGDADAGGEGDSEGVEAQ